LKTNLTLRITPEIDEEIGGKLKTAGLKVNKLLSATDTV
jgi:hypothetical protein